MVVVKKNKILIVAICALLSIGIALENAYLADIWPDWISLVANVAVCAVFLCALVFFVLDKEALFKLSFIVLAVGFILFSIFSILKATGVIEHMMKDGVLSVEAIKEYILSLGNLGLIVYLVLQIAQVTFIPLPSNIVTMAGVGIFGVWPAFILSTIGQIIGSIIAFALGRFFGVKLVSWIIGEETLHKYQEMTKGRDKIMLTLMFLLPVFPDDVLCLIAGLSTMTWSYFVIIMCICRPITCLSNAFIAEGAFNLPFEGWGIVAWIVIIIALLALVYVVLKYSDKFQEFVVSKFKKDKKSE